MKERIIYECEFCRSVGNKKRSLSKDRMYRHENECFYNPKNKTCLTCAHNERHFLSENTPFPRYSVGCEGGAVTQEKVNGMSMSELFGNRGYSIKWECQKYEYDGGEYGLDRWGQERYLLDEASE